MSHKAAKTSRYSCRGESKKKSGSREGFAAKQHGLVDSLSNCEVDVAAVLASSASLGLLAGTRLTCGISDIPRYFISWICVSISPTSVRPQMSQTLFSGRARDPLKTRSSTTYERYSIGSLLSWTWNTAHAVVNYPSAVPPRSMH